MTKAKGKATEPELVDLSKVDVEVLYRALVDRGEVPPADNGNKPAFQTTAPDDDTKALIVIESYTIGIAGATSKYGVSRASIHEWKKRAKTDPAFKKLLEQKNSYYRNDWSAESASTIRKILSYLGSAAEKGEADGNIEPAYIRAQAGALKMVGEFKLAVDITYSKLGKDLKQLPAGEANQEYQITAAEGVIEGDFDDLKSLEE
jgi:hypothetical protein